MEQKSLEKEPPKFTGIIKMAASFPIMETPYDSCLLAIRGIDAFLAAGAIQSDHPVLIQDSRTGSTFVIDPNTQKVTSQELSPQIQEALIYQQQRHRLLNIYHHREDRRQSPIGKLRGKIEDLIIGVCTGRSFLIDHSGNVLMEKNRGRVTFLKQIPPLTDI